MTRSKAEFKAEGLDALRLYLLADRGRERKADLARRFGVDRATIARWIESLEAMGYIVEEDEQRRLYIDRSRYFTHLNLSSQESVVVLLALRLLQQYENEPNQHVASVLQKLGVSFQQGLAPEVGKHVLDMAHLQRVSMLDQRSEKQRRLEHIGDAWINSCKVDLHYRPLRSQRAFDEVFHPYFIEPSAVGHSTYVIGYSEKAGDIRTRKLERIEALQVRENERFDIHEQFDIHKLLTGAWGIWFDKDDQPTTVTLRFTYRAAKRVQENRWHPSERIEADDQGRLIWTADVDEEKEMLPWIRGWGADCEVLEPQSLRHALQGEVRRLMRTYGIVESAVEDREQRFDDIFG